MYSTQRGFRGFLKAVRKTNSSKAVAKKIPLENIKWQDLFSNVSCSNFLQQFFSFVRLHFYGLHRKIASVQDSKLCLWKKFLDDITFLFGESAESFEKSFKDLNNFYSIAIKLKEGRIVNKLYFKSTDGHQYLNYESCHLEQELLYSFKVQERKEYVLKKRVLRNML